MIRRRVAEAQSAGILRTALLSALLPFVSIAYTVAGTVQGAVSGVWSPNGNPYQVVADAYVPAGDTLRVQAGVTIVFSSNCNLRVDGTLRVLGTADSVVTFGGAQHQAGYWGGVYLNSSSDTSMIRYAVVRDALVGVTVSASVASLERVQFQNNVNGLDCTNNASAIVDTCEFANNTNAALRAVSASVTVRRCTFYQNASGGIESAVVLSDCPSAEVFHTELYDNTNAAIEVTGGISVKLANNAIAYNDYGMILASDSCLVSSNAVCYNRTGIAVENSQPSIRYNNVWGNTEANYLNAPAPVGQYTTTNDRGTPSDPLFNISVDPQFVDPASRDFRLASTSLLIDAGDPANPAGGSYLGACPDIGAYETGGTVPVELVDLRWIGDALVWRTASETNNWGFIVERSTDGWQWERVGFLPGHGTTTQTHIYRFVDPDPPPAEAYYRVIQIDTDGNRELHGPLKVRRALPEKPSLAIFPNPTNAGATIKVHPSGKWHEGQTIRLFVFDVVGRTVRSFTLHADQGAPLTVRWDGLDEQGEQLPSGPYTVVVQSEGWKILRKLTLLR